MINDKVRHIIEQAMIPLEVFEEIKLGDEILLWAGKQHPDYVKAQKSIKLLLSFLLLAFLVLIVALCFFYFFKSSKSNGILSLVSIAWLLGAILFGWLSLSTILNSVGNLIVANMHMFITNQRIILLEPNLGIKRIFTGRPFQELGVVSDKQFLTLKACGYANDDKQGHHLKIRGLADAHDAEALIQEHFMELRTHHHE